MSFGASREIRVLRVHVPGEILEGPVAARARSSPGSSLQACLVSFLCASARFGVLQLSPGSLMSIPLGLGNAFSLFSCLTFPLKVALSGIKVFVAPRAIEGSVVPPACFLEVWGNAKVPAAIGAFND